MGSNDDDDGDDGLHEPTLHSLRQQRKEQHKGSSPFPLRQECVKGKNLQINVRIISPTIHLWYLGAVDQWGLGLRGIL